MLDWGESEQQTRSALGYATRDLHASIDSGGITDREGVL